MKKKLLYLLLLIPVFAGAQIVNIPDVNFKNRLLMASTDLNIATNINGDNMVIDVNGDLEIQESEALQVWGLQIGGAEISDATGLEAFINITYFSCHGNSLLSTLNLTSLVNLERFVCDGGTGLEFLSFAGLPNLQDVFILDTNLDTIDLTGVTTITRFILEDVPVTNLDFSSMVDLTTLGIYSTNLININLDSSPLSTRIRCIGNLFLETINIRNGEIINASQFSEITDNPNLLYMCIDEGEENALELIMGEGNLPFFGDYCSFTPGGNYNTITGTMLFDADGDGACDDLSHEFMKIHINDGVNEGDTFSNSNNEYVFYTGAGDFTITPQFENDWFVATPQDAYVSFPEADNLVYTQDFCITALGEHPDVEVVMVPVVAARPGFDAVYKVVYKNKGNQVLSGSVTCGWNYSVLTGVAINPLPDMIVPGTYTWNYTDLMPFENREILMTLHVNSPTDTPPVDSGDILPFTASVESGGGDETPQDNAFVFDQEVVNSLDPNNIICIEGETASPDAIGEYLHYVVNFENTGTAAASFVVIKHEINPSDFDIRTLQVLNSSHDVRVKVNGDFVEFIFENINLAAEDHGNILIKLKSMETLQAGDNVMNVANIYFDYNYPLETNEATTVFEAISGIGDFEKDNSVTVYPNPTSGIVSVKAASAVQSIELYDIQGRLLQMGILNDIQADFDMSQRQSGIYLLKISTLEGVKVEKVIKN